MTPKWFWDSAALIAALLLAVALAAGAAAQKKPATAEELLGTALHQEEVEGNLERAIATYKKVVAEAGATRAVAGRALLRMGQCYEKLGNAEARKAYERVVREYADQSEIAAQARVRLAALGQQPPAVTARRVWAGAAVHVIGAPSRDGAYLTFRDPESGELAIRDLATGQTRLLTKRQSVWERFVPSPDGKQVAYTWKTKGFSELRVVGLDGSEPRVLYPNTGVALPYPAGWSPDGKNVLAVVSGKEGDQVVLVSVADGSVRVLKTTDWIGGLRFSPDGRYIAYDLEQQPGSKECDIFLLALDTGREIPLIQHPADDEVLDWTPDGKRILFRSDRSGTMGAWLIQVADGKPQGTPELVKPDLGRGFKPLGFTRNGSFYYSVRTTRSDVYIAEIDLATGKLLAPPAPATQRFEGSNETPDWSPDGRRLLFLSRRASVAAWAPRVLCVRSMETGELSELASKLDRISWVRWSPDGRSLLAGARHSGGFGIYRIDVRTGEFSRITDWNLGGPAVWSGDGKAIIHLWQDAAAKASSIMVRDLETGRQREIHSIANSSHFYASRLALSRDGRQLAFALAETQSQSKVLKVMPAAGGEARDVLRGVPMPADLVAWTPDGLGLLFTRHSPGDPKTGLWLIPLQGGEPRKLDLAAESMRDLCLHPDGRHIAFTAGQDTSEVWAMENFLPSLKAAGKQ